MRHSVEVVVHQNFIKPTAAVHELPCSKRNKKTATMPKTILPSLEYEEGISICMYTCSRLKGYFPAACISSCTSAVEMPGNGFFRFPLRPIPVQSIPIPSHSHSQFCNQFPFPWHSHNAFPIPSHSHSHSRTLHRCGINYCWARDDMIRSESRLSFRRSSRQCSH